jgi:pSer/pThr/pTyr-binding forkhead associated (FHA) protein
VGFVINAFLEACGAAGPLSLNIESPGGGGEIRAFDLPFVLVGRDPRADLRLDHPDVSDRHGYFQLVGGQLLCVDLGSRSGIQQGGKRQQIGYVERSRPVRIGPYRIRLLGGDGPDSGRTEPALGPEPIPLDLSHRSVRNSRCELNAGLALVGSGADCQIRLVDPSVSNYHCSLVRNQEGVWVVDLLGRGGVRVNGQDVAYARLYDGDVLQVGRSTIELPGALRVKPAPVSTREETPATTQTFAAEPEFATPASPVSDASLKTPVEPEDCDFSPMLALDAPDPAGGETSDATQPGFVNDDVDEELLRPVLGRIEELRGELVDEVRQAREVLFEMFAALRREQSEFLKQEIEQVRQVKEELQTFRDRLDRQAHNPEGRGPDRAPNPGRLGAATPSRALAVAPPDRMRYVFSNDTDSPAVAVPPRQDEAWLPQDKDAHVRLCIRLTPSKRHRKSYWNRLSSIFPIALHAKSTH